MGFSSKTACALVAVGVVVSLTTSHPASALTAELAKKCREMMLKAHPPHTGGGSGNAQEQRKYFNTCVARGGKMEDLETVTEGRDK